MKTRPKVGDLVSLTSDTYNTYVYNVKTNTVFVPTDQNEVDQNEVFIVMYASSDEVLIKSKDNEFVTALRNISIVD